ncbi:hypothetical protein B4589_000585 [Halolamina sp. CBA1230]|uniref:hypothetical protein n=1 Tax=Halolamina sp. CBA1230 TaxID=1853690 RepID=UPI0009A18858|nr:hypothetical protein [Halolamina sp. CBA1230]QKY18938.1 hypothetical protein B4589_000585 [Halolamina sp. CBA1230]
MTRFVDGTRLGRVLALVVASTLALTASFVGIVALVRGEVRGMGGRLPIYAATTALVFVGGVVGFEPRYRGTRSLSSATVVAVAALLVTGLGSEGLVYAWDHPADVFEIQLLGYLLSAALMGTGVGYWSVRNLDVLRAGGLRDAL